MQSKPTRVKDFRISSSHEVNIGTVHPHHLDLQFIAAFLNLHVVFISHPPKRARAINPPRDSSCRNVSRAGGVMQLVGLTNAYMYWTSNVGTCQVSFLAKSRLNRRAFVH